MGKYSPEYFSNKKFEPMTSKSLHKYMIEGSILEALVVSCDDKMTLKLDLGNHIYGYIPFEEVEFKYDNSKVKDVVAMSKVGRHVKFKILSIKTEGDNIIALCSRKEAQKDCYENYISNLTPGDIIDARIVRIENYGVFCDIGCGFVALLPTNNISVTHIINPKELLENITTLKVIVKNTDEEGRIQLSHKELLGTWEEEVSNFSKGDIVCGSVLSVEKYGVFVRLSQNLSGLAYTPENIKVNTGDLVSVRISGIAKDSAKIKLHIVSRIDNCTENMNFRYYKTEGRMDKWIYSTTSKKAIRTIFIGGDEDEQDKTVGADDKI